MRGITMICTVLFVLLTTTASADSRLCSDGLESVADAAMDTAEAAEDLADAEDSLQDAQYDYEMCAMFPETYDLWSDGCAFYYQEYLDALTEYNMAAQDFNAELRMLGSELDALALYCR